MGEYLSTPETDKKPEDKIINKVSNLYLASRLNILAAVCKDGGKVWKMNIYVKN